MTAVDPNFATDAAREERRARLFTRINKADRWFGVLGLAWITPILKAAAGDNPKAQLSEIWRLLGVPVVSIAAFLMLWATLAPQVQTSLGAVPGPAQVWEQAVNLHADAASSVSARTAVWPHRNAIAPQGQLLPRSRTSPPERGTRFSQPRESPDRLPHLRAGRPIRLNSTL